MEFVIGLLEQLKHQLNRMEVETPDLMLHAKQSYRVVETAIFELKAYIAEHTFADEQEEIYFFKELKPAFYSRLIYYMRLFEFEARKPLGSVKGQVKYVRKRLQSIERYTEDNFTFYKYYRSGATHMDHIYFTRNHHDLMLGLDISYFDAEKDFCTSRDISVATILANERLAAWLNEHLNQLLHVPSKKANRPPSDHPGLNWADSKAAFVELIYGLQSIGAFYNVQTQSRADLKDIIQFFETTLNIDLGNYYRVFYDIKLRKKEPASFLERVKEGLLRKINESDE